LIVAYTMRIVGEDWHTDRPPAFKHFNANNIIRTNHLFEVVIGNPRSERFEKSKKSEDYARPRLILL